jgi:drug/metabolite transporter (DMT)-like permease
MSVVMVRRLGSSEPEMRTVFYFFSFGALASGLFLPWHWVAPSFSSFVYLVATGMAGTLGQLLLTRAYAEAPAAYLSTFNYLSILYSTFFGWLLWNEWPHISVFIGAVIVVAAGIGNIMLEKSRKTKIAEAEVEVTYG